MKIIQTAITAEANDEKVTQKSIFLTVGNDTSSQGITWYADTETAGEVQYAVKTGDTFPENYLTVPASSTAANEKDSILIKRFLQDFFLIKNMCIV